MLILNLIINSLILMLGEGREKGISGSFKESKAREGKGREEKVVVRSYELRESDDVWL